MDLEEHPAHMISAEDARKLSARVDVKSNINYNLTLNRLMKIIEGAARQGQEFIEFETPSFVLDGSLADPILLARQLKKKLSSMGYLVTRTNSHLHISWSTNSKSK